MCRMENKMLVAGAGVGLPVGIRVHCMETCFRDPKASISLTIKIRIIISQCLLYFTNLKVTWVGEFSVLGSVRVSDSPGLVSGEPFLASLTLSTDLLLAACPGCSSLAAALASPPNCPGRQPPGYYCRRPSSFLPLLPHKGLCWEGGLWRQTPGSSPSSMSYWLEILAFPLLLFLCKMVDKMKWGSTGDGMAPGNCSMNVSYVNAVCFYWQVIMCHYLMGHIHETILETESGGSKSIEYQILLFLSFSSRNKKY